MPQPMNLMDYPFVVAALSFALLWLSALIGASFRRRRKLREDDREDFNLVIAATLTLLGLIIGFSFSMAVSRYDLRKNYEEAEANAIGTEYVRADLLPAADTERIRLQLRQYLDERVMFYRARDSRELQRVNVLTSQLQTDLWNSVKSPAEAKPTQVVALAVSGMNDVLNSQRSRSF